MRAGCAIIVLAAVLGRPVLAQPVPPPASLVQWVEPVESTVSWVDQIRKRVEAFSKFVGRSTSTAMSESWLCVITRDGKSNRAITAVRGARHPRWGRKGWIAVEMEHHRNRDGIAVWHVSLIAVRDGRAVDIGAGTSPVWSPDGSQLAFIRDGKVVFFALDTMSQTDSPVKGGLVYSDRRSLKADLKHFWLMDTQTRSVQLLSGDDNRYLWLGAISEAGRVAYSNTQRSAILIKQLPDGSPTEVFRDTTAKVVDPSWSPDGQMLVYVSTRRPLDDGSP